MIFRFLYNTYKEYAFIFFYKILVYDLDHDILHSHDIVEGRKVEEKL
jgi:hypothetical protein